MKTKLSLAVAILLGACSSAEKSKEAERRSEKFDTQLRLGMTKKEVEALGVQVANCRGSAASYERCEALISLEKSKARPYLTEPVTTIANQPPTTATHNFDKRNELYDFYRLDFEKGKLKLWTREAGTDVPAP